MERRPGPDNEDDGGDDDDNDIVYSNSEETRITKPIHTHSLSSVRLSHILVKSRILVG